MPRFPARSALAHLGALALLCLALAILGACTPAATVRLSPPATATATPPPTSPTSMPVPDWQGFTDPKFGFTLDVPGVFWVDPNAQPQVLSATDSATLFVYRPAMSATPSPTARLLAASGGMFIYASTAPARCALQGTPVPVGQGQGQSRSITGYRYDTFASPSSGGSAALFGGVRFVAGGVYISLSLGAGGQPNASAYWAAYGPTWQHILASFVAGPATGARPCS